MKKNKKQKTNKEVVSTQDEAGLATRWVSSAACGGVGTFRWVRGLWHLLLLLWLLLLRLLLRIVRTFYGRNNETTR